ncbi:predicted protein [Sclerotinia sclerotiorum 1980 UF-70]|uniref:Uncharacterized protein n=2 Tax=Sclerotinia sclerotiorum (strain ATCC 18683 / 1980 / Ss-1) TaxID=665079 RepID=A7ERR3_SCLS1|nr:predicted protein [Sclerotinia sclerotiorum 1980 UF-70]APA13388.1 hypothetical protein sscle_11g081580 [Sclerotinia sclerotiorum 1980 UF-70]EDN92155.1 predicted protein [Sclerotinia sclerotiorum 1980 UF-70]
MTSSTCTSPTFINWEEWDDSLTSSSSDETIILDTKIDEFYSTFEASNAESCTPTCASPRPITPSSEVVWRDWVYTFDPYSPDETVTTESNISKPDSKFEASSTETSGEDIQLEIESLPVLDPSDASPITPHLAHNLNRICSKQSGQIVTEIAYEQEPIVDTNRDQIEDQLRKLRRDLQNGLLTKGEPAKKDIMDEMSSRLSVLENLKPPAISISVVRIPKLLGAILRLEEIPKDVELRFKERTQTLLNSLNIILEDEDPVKKSNLQPEGSQNLVVDINGPAEISLTEKAQPASLSEKLMEDRIKAPSPQPLVIDLTETDDEPETPSQMNVHELNVVAMEPKKRKRKHPDTSISSLGTKLSPRQSKRVKKVQDYLPQENIWISTALKWIENIVKESDGDTIQIKRTDLLGLKGELEVWRMEDMNVTRELELLE